MMKDNLITLLKNQLDSRTFWIMNDVFYAGGTVVRNISSNDVIAPVSQSNQQAFYIPTRQETLQFLIHHVQPTDRIVVMGARDDTLSDFAQTILTTLS